MIENVDLAGNKVRHPATAVKLMALGATVFRWQLRGGTPGEVVVAVAIGWRPTRGRGALAVIILLFDRV